ncbi:DUF6597 domain-containing transcriptional factor [Paenibacillus pini]|uniref:Transcriptional regulator n=1 Tax=Paenibacillus pini JCM 16418 TaxID=1236976 RepID=W7Z0N7_9BACL|nr:DUF6597 domain-containing transcriptional factor [Paenibacillus pini]GAF10546.1 transcriptional regulator [Paenibacillus pini JCM 16418]
MNPHVHKPSMGVLNLQHGQRKFDLARHLPSPDLQPFVKHFWIVSWDLAPNETFTQELVPNPCINLIVERGRTAISGVAKQKSAHALEGRGFIFGAKFKPGGFYPFVQWPVSQITSQSIHPTDVLGIDAEFLEAVIFAQPNVDSIIKYTESILRFKLPEPDSIVAQLQPWMERIEHDREITKVEHICEFTGLHQRALQRLFNQYIGVHPKWVIKLYRIQNAAETLDYNHYHDLASLSTELGYYDQSHFSRDFKSIVGITPEEYVKQQYSKKAPSSSQ